MASTITLQSVLDFCRTRTRMIQLVNVGGIPNQPGLDICNDVLQTLLSSPNNWKFNKAAIPPFTTIPNQQDYLIAGCTLTVAGKASVHLNSVLSSTPGLTESGNTVTATFSDFAPNGIQGISPSGQPPNFVAGDVAVLAGQNQTGYGTTVTLTGASTTSVTWTVGGAPNSLTPDGGQGISGLSWVEHATLQDWLSTASVKPVHDIEVVSSLPNESIIQPPFKVCMQTETVTTGTVAGVNTSVSQLLMRFWPVPSSQIWNALMFYQLKAPLKTALSQTWSPWPDDLGYVLRSGVYAKALDHGEDPRAPLADSKWQQDIMKALDIRQQEQRHESFFPDLPIARGG